MSADKKRLETLVNRKLDGALTPEERRELDRLLGEVPEARRYLQEMEAVDASLRQVPREEAPPGLEEKVMARIHHEGKERDLASASPEAGFGPGSKRDPAGSEAGGIAAERRDAQHSAPGKGDATHTTRKQGGLIRNLHEQSRRMLRYAAILFIGLVLGAAATILFTEDPSLPATDEMVGSMTARSGQKLAFSQEDWQIQINPMRVDNLLVLVFSAASDEALDVSLGYNTAVYRLNKSHYLSGQDIGSRIGGGTISFGVQDRVHYQLVLEEQSGLSAPFELTVYQDGQVRYNRELVFP